MTLLKRISVAVLPLAFVLAGCQTTGSTSGANAQSTSQNTNAQAANLEVYQASNQNINGFREFKVGEQTIYVSQEPVFTRAEVTQLDRASDNEGNSYVVVTLNEKGQQALAQVPNDRGYAVSVGGQLASLTGMSQEGQFLFRTRNQETANAVIQAVANPQ